LGDASYTIQYRQRRIYSLGICGQTIIIISTTQKIGFNFSHKGEEEEYEEEKKFLKRLK